jgi:hypothetical protein
MWRRRRHRRGSSTFTLQPTANPFSFSCCEFFKLFFAFHQLIPSSQCEAPCGGNKNCAHHSRNSHAHARTHAESARSHLKQHNASSTCTPSALLDVGHGTRNRSRTSSSSSHTLSHIRARYTYAFVLIRYPEHDGHPPRVTLALQPLERSTEARFRVDVSVTRAQHDTLNARRAAGKVRHGSSCMTCRRCAGSPSVRACVRVFGGGGGGG